ncbi:ABC transporter ATP-binding protein [Streptomyces sp. NPDC005318]|uniref:ABC transporter ATP-binding protein n=1 Tax=Streptomyces sp. NPDC005318 TaxID=3157031 RepID=UPI0033AEE516
MTFMNATGTAAPARLRVDDLGMTFHRDGEVIEALAGIDLEVAQGEFVALLGPSGCGKSTLLSCMGALEQPTTGTVRFDGQPMARPDPHQAAYVFQDYSLFPWATVLENVAVGLRFAGIGKSERRAKARDLLEMMGLEHRADARPGELSGGMQQRVAVARALAMQPSVLLMDEPFGALDEQTRRSLGVSISTKLSENDQTVVLVTHSLDEAIYWADRVVVMSARPGRIIKTLQIPRIRPRPLDFLADPEFAALRTELFGLLSEAMKASGPTRTPAAAGVQ